MPVRFIVTALKYTDSTGHYPAYLCTLKREANITNDCPKPNKKPEKKTKMLSQWILIILIFFQARRAVCFVSSSPAATSYPRLKESACLSLNSHNIQDKFEELKDGFVMQNLFKLIHCFEITHSRSCLQS